MQSENPQQLPREAKPVSDGEAQGPAGTRTPAPQPGAPGSLGRLSPPAFHLALFALTFASTLLAGVELQPLPPEGQSLAPTFLRALGFAAALLAILLTHEMGHFLFARRHKVDASWPYFLPAPLFSFVGTLGAVIRLRSLPRTRKALIDIGASGPILGFLVTVPVVYLGLVLSGTAPAPQESMQGWTIWDALVAWARTGELPDLRDAFAFGEPLLMQLFERLHFGALPDTTDIQMHPVLLAGWFGLFVTSLNLLPLGQLDGGHIFYALSPRLHRLFGPLLSAILVGMGVFTPFPGWLLWGVLTGTVLSHHPPVPGPRDPPQPLGKRRIAIAVVSLIVFALSFSPVPLAFLRA